MGINAPPPQACGGGMDRLNGGGALFIHENGDFMNEQVAEENANLTGRQNISARDELLKSVIEVQAKIFVQGDSSIQLNGGDDLGQLVTGAGGAGVDVDGSNEFLPIVGGLMPIIVRELADGDEESGDHVGAAVNIVDERVLSGKAFTEHGQGFFHQEGILVGVGMLGKIGKGLLEKSIGSGKLGFMRHVAQLFRGAIRIHLWSSFIFLSSH